MTNRTMPRSTTKSNREPLLDLIRIVACMIVVMHHASIVLIWDEATVADSRFWSLIRTGVLNLLKYGTGTPIFFALAGFLIMGTLDRTAGNRAKMAQSFWRRFHRIIPPYWLAMGVTAGLFLLLESLGLKGLFSGAGALEFASPHELTKTQWLGNLALIETWRPLISAEPNAIFTRVAWTLCYHEQFIFVAMVLAILAGSKWRGILITSALALMAFQVFLYDTGAFHRAEGLFFDRWYVFGCGLIAWEIGRRPSSDYAKWALTAVLLTGLCAGGWAYDIEVQLASITSLTLAFGSSWIGGAISDKSAKRWAKLAPWTYPIFLMHLPAETICIRFLMDLGLLGFWQRVLVVVPLAMACGVVAGIVFGKLVNFLDSVTIEKSDVVTAGQWIIAKSGLSPQRTWRGAKALPIRIAASDELPRQARDGIAGLKPSAPARRLSDLTPWPNATQ